jgi:GAF domain-containing protein
VATYLERRARSAADSLGAGAHASITFRHFGTTVRAGSSSARSQRCDDAEVRVQDGPCIAAMRSMQPVVLPDLRDEVRWPDWRARFRSEEFGSFAAFPATVGPRSEIAVNVYAAGLRHWTPADLATAARATAETAAEVRDRMRLAAGLVGERLAGPLRQERDRLDLALGIVMEAQGCDPATAERTVRALAARSGTDPARLTDWLVAAVALPQASWNGHRDGRRRG